MTLFREAVERYLLNPQATAERFYLPEEQDFLKSIGYQPAEMHGYVREFAEKGAPSPSTALLIAAVRRNYFLNAMRGISGNAKPIKAAALPAETEEFQEIPYTAKCHQCWPHNTENPEECGCTACKILNIIQGGFKNLDIVLWFTLTQNIVTELLFPWFL